MTVTPDHWAVPYIGTPWIRGEFECWHFAARIWAEQFGITVTLDPGDLTGPRAGRRALADDPERSHWGLTDAPREGDAVLMAKGLRPCHVGVLVTPQSARQIAQHLVLHAVEGAGGICTPLNRLDAMGYAVAGIYRRLT